MTDHTEGAEFLKRKYHLHTSTEVEKAAERTHARTGKELSLKSDTDSHARIKNYLDRLDQIIHPPLLKGHPDFDRAQRNLGMLKRDLYQEFISAPHEIPESYFASIKRRHREEGHGDIEIPDELRRELTQTIITDQKDSLDTWIDYLVSPDAKYPHYLKYWTFRSILNMGRYDKEKKKFTERYGRAVSLFPELNQEALSLVLNAVEKKHQGLQIDFGYNISPQVKQQFLQLVERENFPKLYALAIEEFKPISEELLKVIKGQWVIYPQGSDPTPLIHSLKNYGTGWCLRGEATARRYLHDNTLEVFYSEDQNHHPTVPRVVIVRNGDHTSEVRGVAHQENLDPHINPVVQEKLKKLPDGATYQKKASDMKLLTTIEHNTRNNTPLTKDDLMFLYEINSSIEGFGYQKDPRIKELRSTRNLQEDAPIVFGCRPDEIAWGKDEIRENTKAYVGPLFPHIFEKLASIDHIYTSFPEGKIVSETLTIGTHTKDKLIQMLRDQNAQIASYAQDMLRSRDFTTLEKPEVIHLVRLRVGDLGFTQDTAPNMNTLLARAQEYGLDLIPAEVGLYYRLSHMDQPAGDWVYMGMKPISDSDGSPRVFLVYRDGDGRWLASYWADPAHQWYPSGGFVFRLPKLET